MSGFTDFLPELFESLGSVTLRRMFGGYGVYLDGRMFGLVADDTLYLKADDQNRDHFTARGLSPFQYGKGDKQMAMSYYAAPAEIFDDPEAAAIWARRSHEAALRAAAAKLHRRKGRKE